jgi:hypothetical protein
VPECRHRQSLAHVRGRPELSFWGTQPAIAGAIQVGSDHLSPTVNSTRWVSRTTGVIDVPVGARWLRLGRGCPVSTSAQYACADDLVLSVITDSEPGAGNGAGRHHNRTGHPNGRAVAAAVPGFVCNLVSQGLLSGRDEGVVVAGGTWQRRWESASVMSKEARLT